MTACWHWNRFKRDSRRLDFKAERKFKNHITKAINTDA